MTYIVGCTGGVQLQATLSASSAGIGNTLAPHHPIVCSSDLRLDDDGTLTCKHAAAPPDDPRTRACIDHSIALLLLEVLVQRENRLT